MLVKNLPFKEKWWKIPMRLILDQVTAFKELLGGDKQYFIAIQKAHLAFIKWMLSKRSNPSVLSSRSMDQIPGVYGGSLIWQYFIKGKKLFSEIVRK